MWLLLDTVKGQSSERFYQDSQAGKPGGGGHTQWKLNPCVLCFLFLILSLQKFCSLLLFSYQQLQFILLLVTKHMKYEWGVNKNVIIWGDIYHVNFLHYLYHHKKELCKMRGQRNSIRETSVPNPNQSGILISQKDRTSQMVYWKFSCRENSHYVRVHWSKVWLLRNKCLELKAST